MTDRIKKEVSLPENCMDEKFGINDEEITIKTEVVEVDDYCIESFKQSMGENELNMVFIKESPTEYPHEEYYQEKEIKDLHLYEETPMVKTEVIEETIKKTEGCLFLLSTNENKDFCSTQATDKQNNRKHTKGRKEKCFTNKHRSNAADEDEKKLISDIYGFHTNAGKKDERKFKCSVCGKSFKEKFHLAGHMQVHNKEREKKFKCELCNTGYYNKFSLKAHINKKHLYNPGEMKRHKCNYCEYSVHYRGELALHVRKHTDERPFMCTYPKCDYRARRAAQLKTHIKHCHTFDKSLKCNQCLYCTPHKGNLQKHVRRVHGDSLL